MFPNNLDFFVEERLKERYAEAEQYRLGKLAAGQHLGGIKRILITVVGWVRWLRQSSPEPLQVHPTPPQFIKDMEEPFQHCT